MLVFHLLWLMSTELQAMKNASRLPSQPVAGQYSSAWHQLVFECRSKIIFVIANFSTSLACRSFRRYFHDHCSSHLPRWAGVSLVYHRQETLHWLLASRLASIDSGPVAPETSAVVAHLAVALGRLLVLLQAPLVVRIRRWTQAQQALRWVWE